MVNRLAGSTSPYLLQHQDNPVDWYPWGAEALERAQQEALPLLVSVGYSACHWCHVMERESFEDPETAAVMNANFVCIKVDREERPDVDSLYMEALQAMTGQGGWPMTVFCTPDGRPFHAGTYFPPTDRQGMPAFRRVLEGVAAGWREQRAQVEEQGTQVAGYLGQLGRLATDGERPEEELLRQALAGVRGDFDPYWGGFGTAPKFPQPTVIELLLRLQARGFQGALDPAIRTLRSLHIGGIQDHLAGGFHRYATDERWLVPHFEKMLYDNAQLLRVAVHAWQLTKDDRFAVMARSTVRWLLAEMRDSGGGFWSALDADSEGEEGRFYVWTYEDLVAEVGDAVARCFGASPEGNWEGRNILWMPRPVEDVAKDLDRDPDELLQQVESGRERLLAARARRVRPATDDKILAGWNGLAIGALAEAGRAFHEPEWVAAAEQAATFVVENLRRPDGRLARTWRRGIVGPDAVAEDYGLLAEGCLALYEATGTPRWLQEARDLAEVLLARFVDHEHGGFYQTASDAEQLLVRPKDVLDTALPSGNSAAAFALARLSRLDGDPRFEEAAWSAVQLVTPFAGRSPLAVAAALCAVDFLIGPGQEIVVVGPAEDAATEELLRVVWEQFLPNRILVLATPEQTAVAGDNEPLLAGRDMRGGVATAYVCEQFSCRAPVTDPEALARELQGR